LASVPSLWLARGHAPEEVGTVVVGAGIVGLSTAYWLTRSGRRPVVLDADGVASHASGRNAGFLITGTAEPYTALVRAIGEAAARRLWELSRENRELLCGELLDPGRIDCELVREGSWIAALAGDAGQERELRESGERLAAIGLQLEWRDAAEVRRATGSDRLGGALFQPRDGGLDPVRLCRGMAGLVTRAGGEVRTGVRVRALEPAGDRVRLLTDGGHLLAERVVLALNAYAPALLPHLHGEIRPVRGQILATAPGRRDLSGVWYVNDGYEYLRQLPDGTFVLGGCRWAARDTEVGFEEKPTARVQGALEEFLREAFPLLADRPIRHRWAGIMAFTPDGLPRVGEAPGIPAAIYAAGLNGHGMSLGFATGRWLARRTAGEESGELFPPVSGEAADPEKAQPPAAGLPSLSHRYPRHL
jgi:glycine/D-amino acid oxidase-like deaminating enzyme